MPDLPKGDNVVQKWPKRMKGKEKSGRKIEMTQTSWTDTTQPDMATMKIMLALAFAEALKVVFTKHTYCHNGKFYVQGVGGPIGLRLTAAAARLVCLWFDIRFNNLCKYVGILIHMYARYVDDVNCAAQAIPLSLCYNPTSKSLIPQQPTPNLTSEQHTFNVLKTIGDDISPMMTWTTDIPTNHKDKCIPVLDLKLYKYENKDDKLEYVAHKFYRKEVCRQSTITDSSALSAGTKRSILVAEGLRRLVNTSPEVINMYKSALMEEFNQTMNNSGHKYNFRLKVTQIVLEKYDKKVKECKVNNKSLYRSKSEMKADKVNKVNKKKDWFKSRGFTAVLNVPATPQSILRRRVNRSLERQGLGDDFKLMIREVPGQQVGYMLGNGTSSSGDGRCGRPACLPCMGSEGGSRSLCWRTNPTYKISCGSCRLDGQEAHYIGESGHTAYTRGGWHREGQEAEDHRSVLWQHHVRHHGGKKGDGSRAVENYSMQVTGVHKTPSRRLIAEAIQITDQLERRERASIERSSQILVLNSKAEWHQPRVVQIRANSTPQY